MKSVKTGAHEMNTESPFVFSVFYVLYFFYIVPKRSLTTECDVFAIKTDLKQALIWLQKHCSIANGRFP